MTPSFNLKKGTLLNNQYVLGDVLGQGGFGITYEAWDEKNSRKVAIKEYFPSDIGFREIGTRIVYTSSENEELFQYGLTRFFDEANVLVRFQRHPGIVAVYDLFHENHTVYMVMQYLQGVTLMNLIKNHGGKIRIELAVPLMILTLNALRPVHEIGLFHRDISPDNIMILPNQQVKLIDFGAARYALKNQQQAYSVIYKIGYTPIEQYTSRGNIGPWSDIYALSSTFYRSITGKVPIESMNRVEFDPIIPPSKLGVNISDSFEKILLKGLEVRVEDRYQSVDEYKQAILGCPAYTDLSKTESPSDASLIWIMVGLGFVSVALLFMVIFSYLFI